MLQSSFTFPAITYHSFFSFAVLKTLIFAKPSLHLISFPGRRVAHEHRCWDAGVHHTVFRYSICNEVPTPITTHSFEKRRDFNLPPHTACLNHRVMQQASVLTLFSQLMAFAGSVLVAAIHQFRTSLIKNQGGECSKALRHQVYSFQLEIPRTILVLKFPQAVSALLDQFLSKGGVPWAEPFRAQKENHQTLCPNPLLKKGRKGMLMCISMPSVWLYQLFPNDFLSCLVRWKADNSRTNILVTTAFLTNVGFIGVGLLTQILMRWTLDLYSSTKT